MDSRNFATLPTGCSDVSTHVRELKRPSHHAGREEVSKCSTRGESEESVACRRRSTQVRGFTLAWKSRADITRNPKQEHYWPSDRTDTL